MISRRLAGASILQFDCGECNRPSAPPPPATDDENWDEWHPWPEELLIHLKSNLRLRPSWSYVAERLRFTPCQCKARWQELLEL